MRAFLKLMVLAVALMMTTSGPSLAQTNEVPLVSVIDAAPATPLFEPSPVAWPASAVLFAQQPAGPAPTPRHTGVKTLAKHLVTNFAYLPSMENLYWAAAGGGLALAVHPADDNVNEWFLNNTG